MGNTTSILKFSVIVAEKYTEFLQEGFAPKEAAEKAVRKLIVPVTGTVLTTVVAFAPLIFIKSEMSTLLIAVPIIVILSLSISWFESFFILPNHLVHFVKRGTADWQDKVFYKVKRIFDWTLSWVLKLRYLALIGFAALVGVAGYLAVKKIPHSFNLRISREKIVIFSELKDVKTLDEAREKLKGLEEYLGSIGKSKVDHITTNIGKYWYHGKMMEGLKYAKIQVFMNSDSMYPDSLKKSLMPEIQNFVKEYKASTGNFEMLLVKAEKQGDDETKRGTNSVSIKGDDEVEFGAIEKVMADEFVKLSVIKEYLVDDKRIQKSWRFFPNAVEMSRYGLSPFAISSQNRGLFTPDEMAEMRLDGDNVFLYSQMKSEVGSLTVEQLNRVEVLSSRGFGVPLGLLGTWKGVSSLKRIDHRDGLRNLRMDFLFNKKNKEKVNMVASMEKVKEVVAKIKPKFPNYDIKVVDGDEQAGKNKAWALKVAAVCILGVVFVMALILGSVVQPLMVCMPIPFGLVGIILALYFHNLPLVLHQKSFSLSNPRRA